MADTIANQQNGGNNFDVNALTANIFGTANTAITGYFASQAAKSALKAPAGNTAIVVGGVVVIAVLIFMVVKR